MNILHQQHPTTAIICNNHRPLRGPTPQQPLSESDRIRTESRSTIQVQPGQALTQCCSNSETKPCDTLQMNFRLLSLKLSAGREMFGLFPFHAPFGNEGPRMLENRTTLYKMNHKILNIKLGYKINFRKMFHYQMVGRGARPPTHIKPSKGLCKFMIHRYQSLKN